jgi:AcrR family transcriptional regulator
MTQQPAELPRKLPTQDRARSTVDAIIFAAAHILRTEGSERLTTNRIAQIAGVSIGSLYQYFPNKTAVVAELRARHTHWFDEEIRARTGRPHSGSLRDAIRPAIERLIAMHRVDPDLHRVLALSERAVDADDERAYRALVRDFLVAEAPRLRPLDPELASLIVVRALEAIIHRTALEAPAHLDAPVFVSEVVELVARYVEA